MEKKLIRRKDLNDFSKYESHIMANNPNIRDVYMQSIYLQHGANNFLSWGDDITGATENMLLKAINAICNTNFVFED